MDKVEFERLVGAARLGKRLPTALYIHRDAVSELGEQLSDFVTNISLAVGCDDWNILKLFSREFRLSFLNYPDFYSESYPALRESFTVDLVAKKTEKRDYTCQDNPPILHRKELLVLDTHPYHETFALITKEGEAAGLYDNPSIIGHRKSWEFLLQQKGYELLDGRLFRRSSLKDIQIARERTAISRYQLSAPFQAAAKLNLLDGRYNVLDYGCGRGDDLAILEAEGIDAVGWDPNFRPDGICEARDIVNLGFVINVIEDRSERAEALSSAFALADKMLLVAAMIATDRQLERFTPYKDGVVTSRNTFQKYYSQKDLREYISGECGANPIALASGVFAVFKDPQLEFECLTARYRRANHWNNARRRSKTERDQELFKGNEDVFTNLWLTALEKGRFPSKRESDVYQSLLGAGLSLSRIQSIALEHFEEADLNDSASAAKEDLILAQAMSKFEGRRYFNDLPAETKYQVRHFFSNYSDLKNAAEELLEQLVEPELLMADADVFVDKGLPHYRASDETTITIQKKFIDQLPLRLRAYVECAKTLYGALESTELVKIHLLTGKVSFMGYEGFEDKALPRLIERIKVDLWNQRVSFFDYVEEYTPPLLYRKSCFMPSDDPGYKKQKSFDDRLDLIGCGAEDPSFGMSASKLEEELRRRGLRLKGHRFYEL